MFRISFSDYVVILYVAELVLNYVLSYVICCNSYHVDIKNITYLLSTWFTGYVIYFLHDSIGFELIM